MHSTGRSAALFSRSMEPGASRALSRASRQFLYSPPEDSWTRRSSARAAQPAHRLEGADGEAGRLLRIAGRGAVDPTLDRREGPAPSAPSSGRAMSPAPRSETGSADVDVNVLHQGWLRQLKARSGELVVNAEVVSLSRSETGLARRAGQPADRRQDGDQRRRSLGRRHRPTRRRGWCRTSRTAEQPDRPRARRLGQRRMADGDRRRRAVLLSARRRGPAPVTGR